MKNKFIYVVVDTGTGDTLYTNHKPNKSFLMKVCQKEFCWDDEQFNQKYKDDEILVSKEKVYDNG